ncbi:hypothetical protein K435DRAFT_781755 [Dendrothele bispora CBS 962.96]|uniref:Uncharacterized protein n=1 Tax=Dendrothele bispora (strain CBS 962.96) TaxID=1314807 RepID=A0A4S8LKF7_DENBC|nr:hypothetical protein K435DRAFT_781755 [Dendrothele bispora CBS 962.96]
MALVPPRFLQRPLAFDRRLLLSVFSAFLSLSDDSLLFPHRRAHPSPHTLPIPPICAGCLSSGVPWEEWIRVLTAGLGNDFCSVIANDDDNDDEDDETNHPLYRRPGVTLTTRVPATTKTSTPPAVVLQPRQRAPRLTPKTAFGPRNKAESIKPQLAPTTALRTLAPKSRYTYEGGETGVVTGGVLLLRLPRQVPLLFAAAVLKVQNRVLGERRHRLKERRTLWLLVLLPLLLLAMRNRGGEAALLPWLLRIGGDGDSLMIFERTV